MLFLGLGIKIIGGKKKKIVLDRCLGDSGKLYQVDYQKIKLEYFNKKKSKETYVKKNHTINDLINRKQNLEAQKMFLEASNRGAVGVVNKLLCRNLDSRIRRTDLAIQQIDSALKQEFQNNTNNRIESARFKIVDYTSALDYIRQMYDIYETEIVNENLLKRIVETMPVSAEWTDTIKNKLFEQILKEKKSYCGIDMPNAKNMDYKYRKKLEDRKNKGYSNAVKLFDKFANKIVLFNDEHIGTCFFSTDKNKYGISFNPSKEQFEKNAGDTFFHEIGHHIDYLLGFPSKQKTFVDAFRKDRARFISLYNVSPQNIKEEIVNGLWYDNWCRVSDLICGWNIILVNNIVDTKGPGLRVEGCENTNYISASEEALPQNHKPIQVINHLYYRRLSGKWGHNDYDTVPDKQIYYDFYMSVNTKFNPWGQPRFKYQPEQEAFAEMYETDMGGDADQHKLFKRYFQETWKVYRQIINTNC